MMRAPFIFRRGDRVQVCEPKLAFNGATGTIQDAPAELGWNGFRHVDPRDFGPVIHYWVRFDEVQAAPFGEHAEAAAIAVQHLLPIGSSASGCD